MALVTREKRRNSKRVHQHLRICKRVVYSCEDVENIKTYYEILFHFQEINLTQFSLTGKLRVGNPTSSTESSGELF